MLLAGMMTLTAVPVVSAGITAQAIDETMPAAFDSEPNRTYSKPCKPRFENVPAPLLALVPEEDVTNWKNFNDVLRVETPETLIEYTNTYSFIMTFGLTEDVVRPVMVPALLSALMPVSVPATVPPSTWTVPSVALMAVAPWTVP